VQFSEQISWTYGSHNIWLCASRFRSRTAAKLQHAGAGDPGTYGFFVLDKWQVSRKLTVNYGLRYELPTVAYTINGIASELNPNRTALVVATPGFHSNLESTADMLLPPPTTRIGRAPLGIAYRFTYKTVFRGRRRHRLQPEPDQ
jgi:hypothetical protein